MEYDLKKRYWLFGYSDYYPKGGLNDIEGTFDTIESAKGYFNNDETYGSSKENAYIFDRQAGEIVWKWNYWEE